MVLMLSFGNFSRGRRSLVDISRSGAMSPHIKNPKMNTVLSTMSMMFFSFFDIQYPSSESEIQERIEGAVYEKRSANCEKCQNYYRLCDVDKKGACLGFFGFVYKEGAKGS